MALGNSSIKNVRNYLTNVNNDIKYGDATSEGVHSCFNTFNYVAKNLGEWANDTVIGQSTDDFFLVYYNSSDFEQYVSIQSLP